MKEILVSGDVSKDFERLGVNPKLTYGNDETEYKVYEVSEEDFKILCDEPEVNGTWEDCGWRYCEGSNQGGINAELIVKGKELRCWFEPFEEDLEDIDKEYEEEDYKPEYRDLLTYMCEEIGVSQFRNVCALAKDLAKYNGLTMGELFKIYQG